MGSLNHALDRFFTAITTRPGQNRRDMLAQQAQQQADAYNKQINAQREQVAREKKSMEEQAQFRQNKLNAQIRRGNRARIRGGIFGDEDSNNNPGILSGRLG